MYNKELQRIFEQKEIIDYIDNNIIDNQWITISGDFVVDGCDLAIWSGLVSVPYESNIKKDFSWDVHRGDGVPSIVGFKEDYSYEKSTLDEGLEALVYYRCFNGVKDDYVELSQEFVLFYNLCNDKKHNKYLYLKDSGEFEEVVAIDNINQIKVRTNYLFNFLAVKQMKLVIYFDSRFIYEVEESKAQLKSFKYEISNYKWCYFASGNVDRFSKRKYISRLCGKRIVDYPNKEYDDILDFPEKNEYVEYIVGQGLDGENIYYSCNHNKLNNYFNANPESPLFLTPVYFKKQVLEKYYSNTSLYSIDEGCIECKGMWHLPFDDHASNVVTVYLGDLGSCLPYDEQLYWKSFNTDECPDGNTISPYTLELNKNLDYKVNNKVSKVSALRDNLGSWEAESTRVDYVLVRKLRKVNNAWKSSHGWELFKSLSKDDEYIIGQIRVPLNNSQNEFDSLVGKLAKILVDSLNKNELEGALSDGVREDFKDKGSITFFYEFLKLKSFENITDNIKVLHDIQDLRSYGIAHRKGKKYEKVIKRQKIDKDNLAEEYLHKLRECIRFLDYLLGK